MRERTLKVKTEKLESLSEIYKPSVVAKSIDITKQRWRNYEIGKNDIPESIVDRLCAKYGIPKNELVVTN